MNPHVPILARAHDRAAATRLAEAGATEVIQPELEAAATLIRHALSRLALPRARVLAYLDRFRGAMDAVRPKTAVAGPRRCPRCRGACWGAGALADQSLRRGADPRALRGHRGRGHAADGTWCRSVRRDTVLRPGDRLRIFGLPDQIEALLALRAGRLSERSGLAPAPEPAARSASLASDGGVAAADAEGLPRDPARPGPRRGTRPRGRCPPAAPAA